MRKVKILFVMSLLVLIFLLSSCGQMDIFPTIASLDENIKEIISSKGGDYDFLNDQLYMEKMNQIVEKLVDVNMIESVNFVLGNLDDDTIPEIAVFRQRQIDNLKDTGYLEVYGFNGETYVLIDSVEMNYDHENYDLQIGRLSKDVNGIYLSNYVTKGFGMTYGFILRDGKLQSILNDRKLNLISVDTINKIEDIDGDGILEFSIYTVDPESTEKDIHHKDKLLLWYKWDGVDSGNLVKMENIYVSTRLDIDSNEEILASAQALSRDGDLSFINYLKKNHGYLSINDISSLLNDYMESLNSRLALKNLGLKGLYGKYKIPLDKINDKDYVMSEDTILLDERLKKNIVNNLKSGYVLDSVDNDYRYIINYQGLLNELTDIISNESKDLLKILNLDNDRKISFERFIKKISMMENFISTYPYSKSLITIEEILNDNMDDFLEKVSIKLITEEEIKFIEENYNHTLLYEKISLLP